MFGNISNWQSWCHHFANKSEIVLKTTGDKLEQLYCIELLCFWQDWIFDEIDFVVVMNTKVGDRAQIGAANGEAVVPIVVVGRIDVAGAVEVEVVGAGAVIARSRRPVVAVVAGVGEQVAILIDEAAPTERIRRS